MGDSSIPISYSHSKGLLRILPRFVYTASIRIASNAGDHKRRSQMSCLSRIVAGVAGVSSSVLGNMSFSIMCTLLMMPNSFPQQLCSSFHPSPCSLWYNEVYCAQDHKKSIEPNNGCSNYTLQPFPSISVSYTHLRAHETRHDLVCRL